jgi:hypothetical protein
MVELTPRVSQETEMKYRMRNLIAVAGVVAVPLLATASDFGGGWMRDKDTGTLYYSLAAEPGRHHQAGAVGHQSGSLNSFGGGWAQDRNTGTLYYTLAPEHGQHQAGTDGHQSGNLNSFGGGWVQDRITGTIYYSSAHDVSQGTESAGRQAAVSKAEGEWAHEPVSRTF